MSTDSIIAIIALIITLLGSWITFYTYVKVQFAKVWAEIHSAKVAHIENKNKIEALRLTYEREGQMRSREFMSQAEIITNKIDKIGEVVTQIRINCATKCG